MSGASNGRIIFAVDQVTSLEEIGSSAGDLPSLRQGDFALARGWAIRADDHTPVDAVSVMLGTEASVESFQGLPRPDVAEHFGSAALNSGFAVVFPVTAPIGQQPLAFEARSQGEVLPLDLTCIVSIDPPPNPLAGRHERSDRWAFAIDGIHLDYATPAPKNDPDDADVFTLSLGSTAFIKLWVIDLAHNAPAAGVVARCGGLYLPVLAGVVRRDAAAAVGLPQAAQCGFAVPVSPPISGVASVEIFALGSDDSYAHLGTIRFREMNPLPLSALPSACPIRGRLDEVTVEGIAVSPPDNVTVAPGGVVSLRGWAVDEQGPRLSAGVFATIDGGATYQAAYGGMREDVAAALDTPGIAACEFNVTIDTNALSSGRHRISLVALTARGDAYGAFGSAVFVSVREPVAT